MRKPLLTMLLLAATSLPAGAQTLGQYYHTREPHTCASMKAPTRGPLSGAQAAQYVICKLESEFSRALYLVDDVHVEVGKGIPYKNIADVHKPGGADVDGLVYDIRGSYKLYQCAAPSGYTPDGAQCTRYDHLHAEGSCYRSNFGDWYCTMADGALPASVLNQPPPR